ncbi:MAG TPA: DUF5995 family protein, partial [Nitriliruptorales bacterium]
ADHDALHLPTTDFLPPIVPDGPAPDRTETCGADGLACIRFVEEELTGWEEFFGCDHRAVFATVYRLLTRETRLQIEGDPGFFDDPAGIGWEALKFYELYHAAVTSHVAGQPVPEAWELAFGANADGDWTAGHDMLLSISAHVQRDMPFVVAATGLRLPDGTSRKPDHDRMNVVLSRAYDVIVPEIGGRYDPFMTTIDDLGGPVEDVGAQQLVAYWRERVWRNAENVVASADTPLADPVTQAIEFEAARWANLLTTGTEIPGHREVRDAWCLESAAARGDVASPVPEPNPGADVLADQESADELAATGGGVAFAGILVGLVAAGFRRRR